MKKQNLKKENGFTLVETLVAIFILVLSTTAPMVVAQNGLRTAYLARDQITAFYLAQDAMEYVKNVKDHNGLQALLGRADREDWLDGLDLCISNVEDDGCTIDTFANRIEDCSPINPAEPGCINSNPDREDFPLEYDVDNLTYGFNGSENSKYSRVVRIEEVQPDADAEIKVVTKVRWKSHEGFGKREIEVVEFMTNWAGTLGDPDDGN